MSSPPRLSADGLFYWDGKQWVSALSADGRQRWDGTSWVAMTPAPPPVYTAQPGFMPAPQALPPKAPRTPTSWTRALQYAVGGLAVVYLAWDGSLPFWAVEPMSAAIRQSALRTASARPGLYPDPAGYADSLVTVAIIGLVTVAILSVIAAMVVLIGTIRRWTWTYYVVLALLALSILDTPQAVATAAGIVPAGVTFGGSLLVTQWVNLVLGVIGTGLFAWMLVALLRRGPWATLRTQ